MVNAQPRKKVTALDTPFVVKVQKTQERFTHVRNPDGPNGATIEFFLLVDITAVQDTVYIPLSIASGKKITGFVYQIEGTKPASIVTADVSCKGSVVTQITLGTLLYTKIPKGAKVTFRILVEIKGHMHNTYTISINRINYKLDPSDARYKKSEQAIHSGRLVVG